MLNYLDKVKTYDRVVGVIVDYSNGHGLCYGVVFPNLNGYYGRIGKETLQVHWYEPDEIELYNGPPLEKQRGD